MAEVVERADLYYREGTSDKVYHATLEHNGSNAYMVNFAYGRRGAALQTGSKTGWVDYNTAFRAYQKLVNSKTSKGYQPIDGVAFSNNIPVVAQADDEVLTPKAQLLNPIEEDEALALISDDAFYAQPKHDGVRFMLGKENGQVYALNRRGKRVAVPVEIENTVKNWHHDFFVDSELVGTTVYVFDILSLNGENLTDKPLWQRLDILDHFSEYYRGSRENDYVKHSYTGKTYAEKGKLWNDLSEAKAEGLVFKRADAPYRTGRPNSGGANLKFKFYETCSCIVTSVNNKRSVALGLYDGNNVVSAGNVTISINFDIPSVGDIVEVRYLYARKASGALYQPVYLGKRNDLIASECKVSQLKFKAGDEEDDDVVEVKSKVKEIVIKDSSPARVLDLD